MSKRPHPTSLEWTRNTRLQQTTTHPSPPFIKPSIEDMASYQIRLDSALNEAESEYKTYRYNRFLSEGDAYEANMSAEEDAYNSNVKQYMDEWKANGGGRENMPSQYPTEPAWMALLRMTKRTKPPSAPRYRLIEDTKRDRASYSMYLSDRLSREGGDYEANMSAEKAAYNSYAKEYMTEWKANGRGTPQAARMPTRPYPTPPVWMTLQERLKGQTPRIQPF